MKICAKKITYTDRSYKYKHWLNTNFVSGIEPNFAKQGKYSLNYMTEASHN